MKQEILLSRLLDKYEKSKHLRQPGTSTRRVMLQIEKKELPEYQYEDAQIRDAWNEVVKNLESQNLITVKWRQGLPVFSSVILNLDRLADCYRLTGRIHPKEQAHAVAELISSRLAPVTTDWILSWREEICHQAKESLRIPSYCKKDFSLLDKLLTALTVYDSLHGDSITMRAFSEKCYQNTKTFEKEVRDQFLRIASVYSPELKEAGEPSEMGERDRLAYLGIYARPELYELSGNCTIHTQKGDICVASAMPYGLALPSSGIDSIQHFNLNGIHKIIFIENKTNYDEFILSELRPDELAIYHGGFLSPQKRKFLGKIANSLQKQIQIVFWADIDLGGFQMFERLQAIFPSLCPMRMSEEDVVSHHANGLKRSERYLSEVQSALNNGKYPLFHAAMKKILEYGVTIEQEVFLT